MQKVESFPAKHPQRAKFEKKYRRLGDGSVWKISAKEFDAKSLEALQSRFSNKEFRAKYGSFKTQRYDGHLYVQLRQE